MSSAPTLFIWFPSVLLANSVPWPSFPLHQSSSFTFTISLTLLETVDIRMNPQLSNVELPQDARRQTIEQARTALRQHIGLEPGRTRTSTVAQVGFWLKLSHTPSLCRLDCDTPTIASKTYRISVRPGMPNMARFRGTTHVSFYHVHCFEKIADFSQTHYLDRLRPVTRQYPTSSSHSSIPPDAISAGRHVLDAGAQLLFEFWKSIICSAIQRNGHEQPGVGVINWPAFMDEVDWCNSRKHVDTLSYRHDSSAWNFFNEFLALPTPDPFGPGFCTSLSTSLQRWDLAKRVCRAERYDALMFQGISSGAFHTMRQRISDDEVKSTVRLLSYVWEDDTFRRS
ncbi:uncharacterized protein LY89DRAFT_719640 [Mollisia scopiformis]|uniref:Uncharacterized protein n=1 Tax=Mollisia scopiformis TaxID=149040 RepID=A0A194X724_MOLSC|nr:uncharacterized protein LY89DRAFT_719640 [Mollisia scopiformis]KUJ15971.1 hypothetical protein LY89DRAFT_719640 [Mollisia scopiformis]